MGIENTVIPARFLTLLGHFVALMMLYYTPEGNVNASIPVVHTQKQFDHATQQLDIAIRLGLACFAIEFAGLFGGFSLFEPAYNALSWSPRWLRFLHWFGSCFAKSFNTRNKFG
mmetsp:Transcript_16863/g.18807  ORF Transcript_16863/g.18807 Transcript_16863/m.18807 type:complete len:114 (+) Transcript_16863:58-399(+)